MDKNYWLTKWEENDTPFHEQNVTADLIAYLPKLKLQPGNCVFVPLCGKTKDMLWLSEQGFHVIGVELSPIACKHFFNELNIKPHITKFNKFTKYYYNNIELFCGDLFDLTSDDIPKINTIYDCKALIALPPELRKEYVNHLISYLGINLKILLLTRDSHRHINIHERNI